MAVAFVPLVFRVNQKFPNHCRRKSMMRNTQPEKMDAASIKELIYACGIDLVGIADAQNLIIAYPPRPAKIGRAHV